MQSTTIKNLATAFLFASSLAVISCNSAGESEMNGEDTTATSQDSQQSMSAVASISGTYSDTAVTGNATFEEANGKVKMVLNITVPSKANKSVAVHIHEHPGCGNNGKDAHGHWNPTNAQHGEWGSADFHSGDIGNVELDGDGKGSKTLETDRWTIGGDSTTNILNRSIIIHSGVDDYKSQPSGDAGNRIGCGVITQS